MRRRSNFLAGVLTGRGQSGMMSKSSYKTVDAEITAMMPVQRARGAESRVRNKLSNGPRRAQSNGAVVPEYSATLGHTSVAGDIEVSRKGHGSDRETRWHRGSDDSSLTDASVGDFCFAASLTEGQRGFFHGGFAMVLLTKRWRGRT